MDGGNCNIIVKWNQAAVLLFSHQIELIFEVYRKM